MFDYSLNEAQERRAERLHRECIVVDLLSQNAGGNIFSYFDEPERREFQVLMANAASDYERFITALHWPFELSLEGRSHLIRDWLLGCGLNCGTYGLEVYDPADKRAVLWDQMAARFEVLPWMRRVTTAAEIRAAKAERVLATYAHCQPTRAIPTDLSRFDHAYDRGLRSFMLTYNRKNSIGDGCTEPNDNGLTAFGIEVIRHCNDLGIMVDVSHCGPRTSLEACQHSRAPVNANHTAAYALSHHARAKSNDVLKAIAGTGGIVGVVAVPAFLTQDPDPSINHMLQHISYIAEHVGWQHVAIGTDWPLQAPVEIQRAILSPNNAELGFRDKDRLDPTCRLTGFDDCRDIPNITRGLVKLGCSDEMVAGILGENALRVFGQVCG